MEFCDETPMPNHLFSFLLKQESYTHVRQLSEFHQVKGTNAFSVTLLVLPNDFLILFRTGML